MKLSSITQIAVAIIGISGAPAIQAQQVLTGDTRLACEAILCLSSGSRPSECSPSIRRYFNIHKRKWKDTLKARTNFLKLCPASNTDSNMNSLVGAIASGAGRCDAAYLNATNTVWNGGDNGTSYIDNTLPSYCAAYANHSYTDVQSTVAVYVGSPQKGGFWANPPPSN
ncbi:TrbM/KikA/MpfK family conjugal transfer protein [Denitromonas iodatirespirans]|uniref:Conjugal transfer protein TrbM n=1 Tax=Denitromonas iodatirespirans TaxID=2795389 RepID=A0A944DHL7_DENI1|nr:TrbM/KikA/MpfK family conjugal transfer protein [Denitromonas iodatirespirans]MBT0963018.1 conjugal transfer protein TrbM [Denitromonas iodatirespirans]MCZ4307064.1 TrbM/KikA/MpfK family conjugal transfer protein [Zoogloeaceae bacterium G21618-S1]